MKQLRQNYPILVSIVLILVFLLGQSIGALPLLIWPDLETENPYLVYLIAETVSFLLLLAAAAILGVRPLFRWRATTLAQQILPALPIFLFYCFALAESLILEMHSSLLPPLRILLFALSMLMVGLTEELLFRGLITRILYEKYGKTSIGLWFTVLFSSLLFGMIHLTNAAAMPLGGVLIQMVGALVLGICLSAIFLRSGNLWTVALLHGFMDFAALSSSGLFGSDSLADTVGGYNVENLLGALIYGIIALFLLRPSQIRRLTDPRSDAPQSHLIALMLTVFLTAGLLSVVAVLSL